MAMKSAGFHLAMKSAGFHVFAKWAKDQWSYFYTYYSPLLFIVKLIAYPWYAVQQLL